MLLTGPAALIVICCFPDHKRASHANFKAHDTIEIDELFRSFDDYVPN